MSKPAHNNYLPMFESVCATIQDETMFVSARQKVLLHMNGVMPSEYAGGFPGAAALNNFIDAKIEQSKAFSENFNGAKPADGTDLPKFWDGSDHFV